MAFFVSYFFFTHGSDSLYNIPDTNTLVAYLLFIHGESVHWSIPPEIQFYYIIFWRMRRMEQVIFASQYWLLHLINTLLNGAFKLNIFKYDNS